MKNAKKEQKTIVPKQRLLLHLLHWADCAAVGYRAETSSRPKPARLEGGEGVIWKKRHQMLPQRLWKQMAQGSRIHRNCCACLSGISISRNFWITSQTMQTSTWNTVGNQWQKFCIRSVILCLSVESRHLNGSQTLFYRFPRLKGNLYEMTNYRGITLMWIAAKSITESC